MINYMYLCVCAHMCVCMYTYEDSIMKHTKYCLKKWVNLINVYCAHLWEYHNVQLMFANKKKSQVLLMRGEDQVEKMKKFWRWMLVTFAQPYQCSECQK
jgi:hypothetical protein